MDASAAALTSDGSEGLIQTSRRIAASECVKSSRTESLADVLKFQKLAAFNCWRTGSAPLRFGRDRPRSKPRVLLRVG